MDNLFACLSPTRFASQSYPLGSSQGRSRVYDQPGGFVFTLSVVYHLRYHFLCGDTGGTLGYAYPLRPRTRHPVGRESSPAGIGVSAVKNNPVLKYQRSWDVADAIACLRATTLFSIGQNPAKCYTWNRLSLWLQSVIHDFT